MLLTFGLLGPNKGIETVIRALPAARRALTPISSTSSWAPRIRPCFASNGEAYRTSLERLAEQLGVREHVVFRDQYVTTEELCSYLQAADVFVSPYLNEAQVTSGALSYAMGAGSAVVSTPYWHAQGAPRRRARAPVPVRRQRRASRARSRRCSTIPRSSRACARAATSTRAPSPGRASARNTCSSAQTLARTGTRARRRRDAAAREQPARAAPRPPAAPDRRHRHHPARDVQRAGARERLLRRRQRARAMVALHAEALSGSADTKRLVSTYLAFLHAAQTAEGRFRNFMTYGRSFTAHGRPASDDCTGRALWALGTTAHLARDEGQRLLARQMFERGLPHATELGPRGTALTMLGLTAFLAASPGGRARRRAAGAARRPAVPALPRAGDRRTGAGSSPTLDLRQRAAAAGAVARARAHAAIRTSRDVARESLEFLEATCFRDDRLVLVGNAGWHRRGGTRADADEQPIDAAAFVLAFRGAYLVTRDHRYLRRMREAFAWFLGANRLGAAVYDSATAGCRDGLGDERAEPEPGRREHRLLPAVAHRDAGAGRRGSRVRRREPKPAPTSVASMIKRTSHRLAARSRAASSPSPTCPARRSSRTPARAPAC